MKRLFVTVALLVASTAFAAAQVRSTATTRTGTTATSVTKTDPCPGPGASGCAPGHTKKKPPGHGGVIPGQKQKAYVR